MIQPLHQAEKLAGNLPGLLLQAEKVAQSFMKGVHGRRRVGMGEAFWQFRPYQPGDSLRDVDWRQTAKRGDAFVRQTEWEAAQTIWLYRDTTASMNFTSSDKLPSKKEYAETLLLALGIVLLNGGEQVSLLGTGLAPQAGYNSIQRIYEMLAVQQDLSEGSRAISASSHVILISDFYYPLQQLAFFCEKLAEKRVHGTLIQVFDPAEAALPYNGRVKFTDIENPAGLAIDIQQAEAIREEYAAKFIAHQQALATLADGYGWTFEKFSTDTTHTDALTALYNRLSGEK